MKQIKTIQFPNEAEPHEIVDAKARQDIEELKNNTGNASSSIVKSIILSASNWDTNTFSQTVSVDGVLADNTAQMVTIAPSFSSIYDATENKILCYKREDNALSFYYTNSNPPSTDITMIVTLQSITCDETNINTLQNILYYTYAGSPVDLIDFEYTVDKGQYLITGWKQTRGGQTSTELVIPNLSAILL